jgi:response regulator RpfG family c-di-GMP phosphodiesterase
MSQPTIVSVSKNPLTPQRLKNCEQIFLTKNLHFNDVDILSENETLIKNADIIVLDCTDAPTQSDSAGRVQVAKYSAPDAFIVVIAEKKLPASSAEFIKKSGASVVMLEDEFFTSSKTEFVMARKLRGQWIPVKASELMPGKKLEMNIWHMMPLNRKYVQAASNGQELTPEKQQKLLTVGEFYIKREDAEGFKNYIEKNQDRSANGLKSRCRAQFLSLNLAYKDLVMLLTDQSESASFNEGKVLFEKVSKLTGDLIAGLGATGEAWDVINNSAVDDLTAIDRAPAIAAFSGLISLMSDTGKPQEIMMAALLADIGLLDLNPQAIKILKESRSFANMKPEDQEQYFQHPLTSLNKALNRKLPIPEKLKGIILCTHERWDGKGFPKKLVPEKIEIEALLIQFAEKIDQACMVEFGKERPNVIEMRKKVWQTEFDRLGTTFPLELLNKLKEWI